MHGPVHQIFLPVSVSGVPLQMHAVTKNDTEATAPTHADCHLCSRKWRTWHLAGSSRLGNITSQFGAWSRFAGTPVPRGRGAYIELDGIIVRQVKPGQG